MDIYFNSNKYFDFGAEKIVPKKTVKEKELFDKWRYVLSRTKVSS